MRIYLDTKDIIKLLEHSLPCTAEEFENILRSGGHELIFSLVTILEISEPLLHKNAPTNVMRLLNQIEKLPHTFIYSSSIVKLEIEEAYNAFIGNNEYRKIALPFENRFDIIIDLERKPATKSYLNYPLSEIVWDLFNHGGLGNLDSSPQKLKSLFEADRAISPKPKLKSNFVKTIGLSIQQNKLEVPFNKMESFANWIYSKPTRCPSIRLGYELWHKMIKNIEDIPEDSDLEDFHNIDCLPYVNFMTLDRRMHGYVCQVSKSLNLNYDQKIFRHIGEFINLL
jgi:hypothetical protein